MNVSFRNIRRFLEGGPMGAPEDPSMAPEGAEMAPEGAPMPEEQGGGEDPLMMLAQMSMQALQSQDCNMAMQVCEGFVQLIQQAQGGAPEGAAPAPEGEPVYRSGGRLVRRVRY